MNKMKVTDIKQLNIRLTDDGRLSLTPKTQVALLNPALEIIWIKHSDSLAKNNDACVYINVQQKRLNVVKKYKDDVKRNKGLRELISYYRDANYSIRGLL